MDNITSRRYQSFGDFGETLQFNLQLQSYSSEYQDFSINTPSEYASRKQKTQLQRVIARIVQLTRKLGRASTILDLYYCSEFSPDQVNAISDLLQLLWLPSDDTWAEAPLKLVVNR